MTYAQRTAINIALTTAASQGCHIRAMSKNVAQDYVLIFTYSSKIKKNDKHTKSMFNANALKDYFKGGKRRLRLEEMTML